MNDVIFKGMNLSAMKRNFTKLQEIVITQRQEIKLLKKDLGLCFERIEEFKKNDPHGSANIMDIFNKAAKINKRK